MTTLAYRNGCMAADTMEVFAETKYFGVTKIIRGKRSLFGYSGPVKFMSKLFQWWEHGDGGMARPETWDNDAVENCIDFFALLVIQPPKFYNRPDGPPHQIFRVTDGGVAIEFKDTEQAIALGSGAPFALGAMFAGSSVFDAVRAAVRYDLCTGGPISTISFEDEPWRSR